MQALSGGILRIWRLVAGWIIAALVSLLLLTVLYASLGWLQEWDLGLQAAVHGWTSPGLTTLMLVLTFAGKIEVFVPVAGLAVVWMFSTKRKYEAKALAYAIAGALLLNEGLKLHFHRPRPTVPWSIGDEATYSFPSGHALFATMFYATLTYLAWRAGKRAYAVLAVAMPLGIGLSRIYLGMHFPSDVLAGYLAGLVWFGCVVWAIQTTGDHSPAVRL